MKYYYRGLLHGALAGTIILLLMTCFSRHAKADVQIIFDNGLHLIIPKGWVVDVHPLGFNTNGFSWEWNPTGKIPNTWLWEGWPELTKYCTPPLSAEYTCLPIRLKTADGKEYEL